MVLDLTITLKTPVLNPGLICPLVRVFKTTPSFHSFSICNPTRYHPPGFGIPIVVFGTVLTSQMQARET